MNFYKIICIIAIIILIVSLAGVGVALQNSTKDVIYPPNISKCPDFYTYNEVSGCTTIYKNSNDSDCNNVYFTDITYNNPGMGKTSGLCKKKEWAQSCGVNWDGITNNTDVCYKTIQ